LKVRYFIFSEDGPNNWARANEEEGPYWDRRHKFNMWQGYKTRKEAEDAIELNGKGGVYFIIEGFQYEATPVVEEIEGGTNASTLPV
jgi:hypothetical protein